MSKVSPRKEANNTWDPGHSSWVDFPKNVNKKRLRRMAPGNDLPLLRAQRQSSKNGRGHGIMKWCAMLMQHPTFWIMPWNWEISTNQQPDGCTVGSRGGHVVEILNGILKTTNTIKDFVGLWGKLENFHKIKTKCGFWGEKINDCCFFQVF